MLLLLYRTIITDKGRRVNQDVRLLERVVSRIVEVCHVQLFRTNDAGSNSSFWRTIPQPSGFNARENVHTRGKNIAKQLLFHPYWQG